MQSLPDDLKQILAPGEQVQFYVRQKIYHPKVSIDSVAITNMRVILRHPHAMGLKKDYTDYNYQDISNVMLDKGILRSSVRCTLRFGGDALTLGDLLNSDAQQAYGLIRVNLVRYQSPYALQQPPAMPILPRASSAGLDAATCRKCGAPLVTGQRYCGNCGLPI